MTTESKALAPIDEVRQTLEKMAPQFKRALPPQIKVEKFVRVVQTAVASNPDLLGCDRKSLYAASMKCATDGLIPDGREAALVKFGNEVVYMPMVGGILKKVRNSGDLQTIAAHVVYDNDQFDYVLGDDERIEHKPLLGGDRGKPKLTYAIAKTKDGGIYREIMTEAQIQSVREVSRAKNSGPWSGPFADEMRRKTVIRRLSKRLPMSTDVEDIIRRDDDLYDLNGQPQGQPMKDVTQAQSEQTGKGGKGKRPKALEAVAQAGGTHAPQQQNGKQPETIEGTAAREPEQAQQQRQSDHPTDVI